MKQAETGSILVGTERDVIIQNMGEVVIEVKNLLSQLEESVGMEDLSTENTKPSIYKIPQFLREVQPKAYEPKLVSLGPYHYGKPHLLPMEREKQKAFFRFKTKNNLDFESIVESVSSILEYLLESYDNLDDIWKQNPAMFLKLMIVDACFMLDFIIAKRIESLHFMDLAIQRDMLLLENQLPMELLQHLYTLPNKNKQNESENLRSLIWKSKFLKFNEGAVIEKDLHILGMYRASLLLPQIMIGGRKNERMIVGRKNERNEVQQYTIIPQATELHARGVKFRTSTTNSLNDVSFKEGVLSLPRLVLDDDTETNLLNVMAFEKLHVEARSEVTAFVGLMDNLIDVDKDVAFLSSEGIIVNALGNDASAADLFNLLAKEGTLDMDSHLLRGVLYSVNQYSSKTWNAWWASLKPDYLQHKWALISVLAATFGFAIIIVQLAYQIADYNRRN